MSSGLAYVLEVHQQLLTTRLGKSNAVDEDHGLLDLRALALLNNAEASLRIQIHGVLVQCGVISIPFRCYKCNLHRASEEREEVTAIFQLHVGQISRVVYL